MCKVVGYLTSLKRNYKFKKESRIIIFKVPHFSPCRVNFKGTYYFLFEEGQFYSPKGKSSVYEGYDTSQNLQANWIIS